jgi:phosphatidylserine/phosphatidylglycerophosphate/cardiolipin synthase-like enzyme
MAVIDDEMLLIGSANCNNRGWETDSELVVASVDETTTGSRSSAQLMRMQLWAHHLDQPSSAFTDPIASRALWDRAPTRHVCRYNPTAGTDSRLSPPDRIVDPPDRRRGDPCCTLLRLCP